MAEMTGLYIRIEPGVREAHEPEVVRVASKGKGERTWRPACVLVCFDMLTGTSVSFGPDT